MKVVSAQAPVFAKVYPSAPEVARRVAVIIASLIPIIGKHFNPNPRLLPLGLPLVRRLNRAVQQFTRLMARLAAGKLPKPRTRRVGCRRQPTIPGPRPNRLLPGSHAWLQRILGWEGNVCASQLEFLLAQPEVAQLLAEVPAAARILHPIRWILGFIQPAPRRRKASSLRKQGPRKPKRRSCESLPLRTGTGGNPDSSSPSPYAPGRKVWPTLPWLLPKKPR